MVASVADDSIQTLRVEQDTFIAAPMEIAFEALLEELGPAGQLPDGKPMPMVVEPFPGGRWFRDLGNSSGHFWGHVQVIKPPVLLEISGPLFMSYACMNHLQYRLAAEGTGTRLKLLHRAIGEIAAEHRAGVTEGWKFGLNRVREIAEARRKSK
jgi:hypothetical protein